MRFLLRMAFWFGVVLVLIPSGGSQPMPKTDLSATEAMSAAKAAYGDMRQFCERQADVCNAGSQAAIVIGHRAQAGAKIVYEFLNEQLGPIETGSVSPGHAGSAVPLPPAKPSQHTLTAADIGPAWRGPQPQREARVDRRP